MTTILISKLGVANDKKGNVLLRATIGDDLVTVNTFGDSIPENAMAVKVGDVEDHTFTAPDKDGNEVEITVKRAKFLGYALADRLTEEQRMRIQGEIRSALIEKAGTSGYKGSLNFE